MNKNLEDGLNESIKTLFNRTFILAFTCGDFDGLGLYK